MNKNNNRCPICNGHKKSGTTTFSAELGSGLIVIRNVKAKICSQCGEEWIDYQTAEALESIVERAKKKQPQFEVVAL